MVWLVDNVAKREINRDTTINGQKARGEREEFAAFPETLTPEQREPPTLCDARRVREVAIHTVS